MNTDRLRSLSDRRCRKCGGKCGGLAAQIGVVAVLGGRTFNLSARRSWRIHLKCPSRPASSGTQARPYRRPAESRPHRCLGCCQASQRPVRLLGTALVGHAGLAPEPALSPGSAARQVSWARVTIDSESKSARRPGGTCRGIGLHRRHGLQWPVMLQVGDGVYLRIRTPA